MRAWLSEFVDGLFSSTKLATAVGLLSLVVSILVAVDGDTAGAVVAAAGLVGAVLVALRGAKVRDLYGPAYAIENAVYEWDIQAGDGSRAVYRKTLDVRFLYGDVKVVWDELTGAGTVVDFTSNAGRMLMDLDNADPRKKIISFGTPRRRGQRERLEFEWVIEGVFLEEDESVEVKGFAPTKHHTLRVLFPRERPPRRAVLLNRTTGRIKIPTAQNEFDIGGRRVIEWKIARPEADAAYAIEWTW